MTMWKELRLLVLAAAVGTTVGPGHAAPAESTLAWNLLEDLTTEIGPRPAGSAAEARARDFAVARLTRLGFKDVHVEQFDVPVWQRGTETAEVVAPFPQRLIIAALSGTGSTASEGVTAQVVAIDGIEALTAAPTDAVRGKIVFLNHHMAAQQDFGSYGALSILRNDGPAIAASKGAVAILVRSLGTDNHRLPHTGITRWSEGQTPIPAAALSTVDADQLSRILDRGGPVTLHVTVSARTTGAARSGNVVATVPGRDRAAPIILIGGHLDSWDAGTGAIDDGAGVAIMTAAAKAVLEGPKPLHSIRLVWFGSEERGGFGGAAYAKAHGDEPHMFVAESDSGGDRAWRVSVRGANPKAPVIDRLVRSLAPLGITRGDSAFPGGDIAATVAKGWPMIDLQQDGTRYFEAHHTADDTLDKVDPRQLAQNVAAWTIVLRTMADASDDLGRLPPSTEKH